MDSQRFQAFAALLGREHTIVILEELYNGGWSTASEIAHELGSHIATAQKYLYELQQFGAVESRNRPGSTREVIEYQVIMPEINLRLDISSIVNKKQQAALKDAKRLFVRERQDADASFDWDDDAEVIRRIDILRRKGLRTKIVKSVTLNETEGRVLWHLPYASEEPRAVFELCQRANTTAPAQVLKIVELMTGLGEAGIIEVQNR